MWCIVEGVKVVYLANKGKAHAFIIGYGYHDLYLYGLMLMTDKLIDLMYEKGTTMIDYVQLLVL